MGLFVDRGVLLSADEWLTDFSRKVLYFVRFKISVSPLSSHENDNMANVLNSQSPGLELSIGEITVASAVASEKARVRQQSAMLDKVSAPQLSAVSNQLLAPRRTSQRNDNAVF